MPCRRRRDRPQGAARALPCAARWCRWDRTRSTAATGTGTRSTTIRSSARTRDKAAFLADYLDGMRKDGSSIGAVIEVVAEGVPAGLGAPIYGKLDSDLASALMSINAVKGVEIGAGFGAAALSGEENADEMRDGQRRQPVFLSNHAGGILGGISTGQAVVARFAVKPTSSILTPRRTIDRHGAETEIAHQGPARPVRRHSRGPGGRGDGGLRARRPPAATPRPGRDLTRAVAHEGTTLTPRGRLPGICRLPASAACFPRPATGPPTAPRPTPRPPRRFRG